MASEPPVSPETPTPAPEKKSHTTRNALIIVLVIVVILALFFGLFFGLRGCDNDEPDDVNPDPDIVEPGPVDPNSEGDDGEPTHTEHIWVWEHDEEGHWQVCSVCGETTTKNSHTLSYTKGNDTSHTVKCDTCGYEATKEHTLEYVSDGATGHHQVCSECQYATATVSHDLGSYISDGENNHYQECSLCDYKSEENHTWTETSTTPATCTTEGATYYKCELCGATKTTTIAALGHEWSSEWSYDGTNHWHACTREGCTAKNDETTHTLGEQTKNTNGNYYQTCSVCGYTTEPVAPIATYINVTGDDDLVVHYNNQDDSSTPETLDLRNTITVTILDQFNNEYTGTYGSGYTLSTTSSEISLNTETGVVTGVSEGTATVTVTSVANTSLTEDIEIEVTEKEYEVESISISIGGEINSDGYVVLAWGATSDELQVAFTPTYATVQTYEVTPYDNTGLFTYDKTTNTFTHTRLNTGTETFTITATDQSNSASTTITLECDPVIDEPYEVVWKEESPLPETIAKGESITDLDQYVEVHYNHTGQDEHEYEDDTYTLSYTGSSGVKIEGSKATFTGDGGTTQYITVTATPDSGAGDPVYAQSSNITITQAVTDIDINYSEYIFNPSKNISSVDLEVTLSPEDYWPTPEIEWTLSEPNDADDYLTLTPDDDDPTQCNVEVNKSLTSDQYIEDVIVTAAVGELTSVSCNFTINTYDFATDSWEIIDAVAASGLANQIYTVGDAKTINVGEEEHSVRIIGFNHDTLTTNSDSSYNNNSGTAAITCEMVDSLSTAHAMNNSNTNNGGWYSCAMRSYLNSDEGCVLSTLDSDLQSVIKKVDKKSTAGGASTSLGETASDSLFLLARVEVDGTTDSGYVDEGTQYAYWSDHINNSDRIKKINEVANPWVLRSPYTGHSTTFCFVTNGGVVTASSTSGKGTTSSGVSFAFCI